MHGVTVASPGASSTIRFGAESVDDDASIHPGGDNAGKLGTTDLDGAGTPRGYRNVVSHNYTTLSPDPEVPDVDLDALPGKSWRRPPKYATRRDTEDGYERRNPNKHGLSLDHMANWLLEVNKAQQERIDDLEQRLSALESN